MAHQQLQITRPPIIDRRGQIGMGKSRASDRERVDRVGLAIGACALPGSAISFGGTR
jgi:hypothetical protein